MTKDECPRDYFDHLVQVIMAVFAAENKLREDGVLTKDSCKGKSAEWYCEKVAEEFIRKADPSDITDKSI